MVNFRTTIGSTNVDKEYSKLSPLEQWFESMLDVPFDEFTLEELCRSVRQKLCISYLLPKVLDVLKEDPMAGENYDGELIAAIASLKATDVEGQAEIFQKIKSRINTIDISSVDEELKKDIATINEIIT
ncbi:hypothetical protein ACI1AR_003670 [Cronobacter dublinensis]